MALSLSREPRLSVSGLPGNAEPDRQVAAPGPEGLRVGEGHLQEVAVVREVRVPGRLEEGQYMYC